jgi:hypothetical protein
MQFFWFIKPFPLHQVYMHVMSNDFRERRSKRKDGSVKFDYISHVAYGVILPRNQLLDDPSNTFSLFEAKHGLVRLRPPFFRGSMNTL